MPGPHVKRRLRYLLILGSACLHVAVLTMLLRGPQPVPAPADVGAMAVSLINGRALEPATARPAPQRSAPPDRAKLRAPPDPTDVAPQFVEVRDAEPQVAERNPLNDPVAQSVIAAAAEGQPCQLGAWLQVALQADPQVQAALSLIPRPARSVANAVMLWDGAWVDAPRGASAGVGAVRLALITGIRSAPATCQTQMIRGAELLTLTDGPETTVLAVGAGQWRWIDLLATAEPAPLA